MRLSLCAVLLVLSSSVAANGQANPPNAVAVETVRAERKQISKSQDFVGRVEAVNKVEIRARVKGFLETVLFKEGDLVKAGDALYQIEKGLFEAAVQQAQGALERSKAAHELAVIQLQRAGELLAKQVGTEVARDQARAQEQQAKGAILTDEANLQTANINLDYTRITAPVTGKIGRSSLTKGNVVGPETGALTIIVSQDPMYVTFPVSQREGLRFRESGRPVDVGSVKVRLRYSDGSLYDQVGTVDFIDVSVDRSTDTILVRAIFPNPNGGLVDNQLVRVLTESGAPEEKVVVPQSALIADQEGVYVFVIEDGKAVVKRIKPGSEAGMNIVVEQGLSGDELVIVEGLQAVRPGTPVRATPMPGSLGRS
jgi:membrane fusion protein (multidrug efflux system)